jgi:hypothetical protein
MLEGRMLGKRAESVDADAHNVLRPNRTDPLIGKGAEGSPRLGCSKVIHRQPGYYS